MEGLDFPFVELTEIEFAFGGVPNSTEAFKACPAEFWQPNKWSEAAQKVYRGLTVVELQELKKMELQVPLDVAKAQYRYLKAWLRDFRISHEEKLAITGWLMSLMFPRLPNW